MDVSLHIALALHCMRFSDGPSVIPESRLSNHDAPPSALPLPLSPFAPPPPPPIRAYDDAIPVTATKCPPINTGSEGPRPPSSLSFSPSPSLPRLPSSTAARLHCLATGFAYPLVYSQDIAVVLLWVQVRASCFSPFLAVLTRSGSRSIPLLSLALLVSLCLMHFCKCI